MRYLVKFIFFCSVFSCASSCSEEGVTRFSKGLNAANRSYCNFINEKESNAVASIPYAELQEGNTQRFVQACGNLKNGKVVDQPATQAELNAISKSLWQHSAALLENPAIFDNTTRTFQKQGLSDEVHALMDKTLLKENDDDDQKEKRRINAIHFLNGLSYAMKLLSGDNTFNIFKEAERDDLNIRAMNPHLKNAMDSYFERLYASSYKGNDKKCSDRGHFVFIVAPKSIEPRYTLLQRRYVANFNQDMNRKNYQEQSPCYAARVASVEVVDAWAPNDVYFHFPEDERNVTVPLRLLILSEINTEDFPSGRGPITITKHHIKGINDIQFEMDKSNGEFLATNLHITITEHRAKELFQERRRGEYAYTLLDYYGIFPKHESVEWSDQPLYFMHVNKKKREREEEALAKQKIQEEEHNIQEILQPVLPAEDQSITREDENLDASTVGRDTRTEQRSEDSASLGGEDSDKEGNVVDQDDQDDQ